MAADVEYQPGQIHSHVARERGVLLDLFKQPMDAAAQREHAAHTAFAQFDLCGAIEDEGAVEDRLRFEPRQRAPEGFPCFVGFPEKSEMVEVDSVEVEAVFVPVLGKAVGRGRQGGQQGVEGLSGMGHGAADIGIGRQGAFGVIAGCSGPNGLPGSVVVVVVSHGSTPKGVRGRIFVFARTPLTLWRWRAAPYHW
jgi:hypothetical protein